MHLDIFGLEDDLADVNTTLRRVLIFNAVFIPILALALGVTAYFVQLEFRQLAEQQVLENAHLMMETAKASRVYTTVVNIFNRTPSKTDLVGYRETPEGPSLYYSAPIQVDSQSCLSCHASAEDAPREMTKIYGKNNGFGWKLNDIIGAQIVSVPARLVNESADAAVTRVLCWLAAGYALVFVVVNLGVYFLARR